MVNKVILVGRVGEDPTINVLENGFKVANFSLATNESYKDKEGNKQEVTDWHHIVLWRGLAEIAEQYVNKGSQLFIEGKIKTRSYEDKDGNKRYVTEIYGNSFKMLGGNKSNSAKAEQQAETIAEIDNNNPDDLPF